MNRLEVYKNDWTRMNGVHFARPLRGASEEGNRDEGGDGGKIELPFFARALSVRPSVLSPFSLSLSLSLRQRSGTQIRLWK